LKIILVSHYSYPQRSFICNSSEHSCYTNSSFYCQLALSISAGGWFVKVICSVSLNASIISVKQLFRTPCISHTTTGQEGLKMCSEHFVQFFWLWNTQGFSKIIKSSYLHTFITDNWIDIYTTQP